MADDQRTAPYHVELLHALQLAAHEFDFFQALRRLEALYRDRPRWGRAQRPNEESIRFGQDLSLAFAPTACSSFAASTERSQSRLGVLFFGAFGPNGPLPLHLTEYARQRLHQCGDATFARFVDIFHHRLLTLFYRVWASSRPAVQRDRPESDRFAMYVGATRGLGMPALQDRDAFPDRAKLYYAGRFACQACNAEGLREIVADFFAVSASIEERVGGWLEMPRKYGFTLRYARGRSVPQLGLLGASTLLGTRVWSTQHKFRLVLGPLDYTQFQRFSPGGQSVPRLVALVRNYVGDELAWDLRLVPKREAVQPLELGRSRLGWSTWLVPDTAKMRQWQDLIFDPQEAGRREPVQPHARVNPRRETYA